MMLEKDDQFIDVPEVLVDAFKAEGYKRVPKKDLVTNQEPTPGTPEDPQTANPPESAEFQNYPTPPPPPPAEATPAEATAPQPEQTQEV